MNDTASPLSSLDLPGRLLKLLEEGGFANVGDLASRLEDDPKSILALGGIGPKALLSIRTALEAFANEPAAEYREPVQSLGDQFKSMPPEEPTVAVEKAGTQEKAKKEKNKKDKKVKKADKKKDKQPKKADKKKDKKSKKVDKKKEKETKMADKKKDKDSKKGKDKKNKKKDKKTEKKTEKKKK